MMNVNYLAWFLHGSLYDKQVAMRKFQHSGYMCFNHKYCFSVIPRCFAGRKKHFLWLDLSGVAAHYSYLALQTYEKPIEYFVALKPQNFKAWSWDFTR